MIQHDRKVYDSDLSLSPLLKEIAHTYAREYIGNFDMMIQAKVHLTNHGCLNEGMYRPVLNTLRCDVLRPDLWGAVQSLLTPIPERDNVYPIRKQRPGRPKQKWPHHKYKGVCKLPVATTISKAAHPVAHLVRYEMVVEWWMKPLHEDRHDYPDQGPLEVPKFKPETWCRSRFHGLNFWDHVPTVGESWAGHSGDDTRLGFCRSCILRIQDELRSELWLDRSTK